MTIINYIGRMLPMYDVQIKKKIELQNEIKSLINTLFSTIFVSAHWMRIIGDLIVHC